MVSVPAWRQAPTRCHAERDCGCCGAMGALICLEPADHDGVHAFLCRRCNKGDGCLN